MCKLQLWRKTIWQIVHHAIRLPEIGESLTAQWKYMKCAENVNFGMPPYRIRCTVTPVVKFALRHICTLHTYTWSEKIFISVVFVPDSYFSGEFLRFYACLKMPATKDFERKCTICQRKDFNDRMLGPLIHTKTISGHFNCVLYSPIMPDAVSIASNKGDDGIAGVKSRFIREEGARASKLVIIEFNSILFQSYSFVRFAFLYIP